VKVLRAASPFQKSLLAQPARSANSLNHNYSSILTRSSTPLVLSSEFVRDGYASSSFNLARYEVSKAEAMFYYAGISPTPPKLVYRTGGDKTPWVMPKGQQAYRRLKQAPGVFSHKLNAIWNDDVGPKVRDLLIAQKVAWTSINVVRFVTDGDGDEKISGPVVILGWCCPRFARQR